MDKLNFFEVVKVGNRKHPIIKCQLEFPGPLLVIALLMYQVEMADVCGYVQSTTITHKSSRPLVDDIWLWLSLRHIKLLTDERNNVAG